MGQWLILPNYKRTGIKPFALLPPQTSTNKITCTAQRGDHLIIPFLKDSILYEF